MDQQTRHTLTITSRENAGVTFVKMQGSLSASRDQVTWVLTSYIVAAAIMTAPVGWLASRFGKKNVAVVSLAGFTIASMLIENISPYFSTR